MRKFDLKKSIMLSIILSLLLTALFGCGSMRPSRINERDDLSYKRETHDVNAYIGRDTLRFTEQNLDFQVKQRAFSEIDKSREAPEADKKYYTGIAQNIIYDGTIKRYIIYLGNEVMADIDLKPGQQQEIYLPLGTYQVEYYRGNTWGEWNLMAKEQFAVKNLAVDGRWFFKIQGPMNKNKR